MVFNATYFSYIVAVSYLGGWVEETGVPGENHRPTTSNWQAKIYIPFVILQLFDQTTIVIAAILQASGSSPGALPLYQLRHKDVLKTPNKQDRFDFKTSNNEMWMCIWLKFGLFNATFNHISVISCQSVLLLQETGGPGEDHRPVASHWQTLSHNALWSTPRHKLGSNWQL